MVNYTGSFSALASSTVAATTIRTQMQTTIPSHSNWTLVESTTMNAGAVPCDVYKCASAGTGYSQDFYVGVMQISGTLAMNVAEGYNSTTHKAKRPAMNTQTTLQTLQADGGFMPASTEIDFYNGSYNPGGGSTTAATNAMSMAVSPTDDYIITVSIYGVTLFIRTAGSALYAGGYDSSVPTPATNDPLPIWGAKTTQGSAGNFCFATRLPLSGSQSRGYANSVNGRASSDSGPCLDGASAPIDSGWAQIGTLGGATVDHYDLYSSVTGPQALKFPLFNSYLSGSSTVGRDKNGWLRGYAKQFRHIKGSTGFTPMDTCTVDGVSYTLCSGTANSIWYETNPA